MLPTLPLSVKVAHKIIHKYAYAHWWRLRLSPAFVIALLTQMQVGHIGSQADVSSTADAKGASPAYIRQRKRKGMKMETTNEMKLMQVKANEAAARFLSSRGYDILEVDWECFAGTIDLIAQTKNAIVFVNVLARVDDKTGFPSTITPASKRERLEKIALAYISESDARDIGIRFDEIAIVVKGINKGLLRHHVNIMSVAEDDQNSEARLSEELRAQIESEFEVKLKKLSNNPSALTIGSIRNLLHSVLSNIQDQKNS